VKRERNRQLRVSRTLLTACGVLLLAAGVAGLLLATGLVDRFADGLDADSTMLDADGREWLRDHERTLQILGVVLGLIFIALGLWWLKEQLPPRQQQEDRNLETPEDQVPGTTIVRGHALADALEQDLERSPIIERARATLRPSDDRLHLRLDVVESATAGDVQAVIAPAVDRLVTVAELPVRPDLEVDLRLASPQEERVA
jgi:hypothetical protein